MKYPIIYEADSNEFLGSFFSIKDKVLRFSLWAPLASSVEVLLFASESDEPFFTSPMKKCEADGVWHFEISCNNFDSVLKDMLSSSLFYLYKVNNGGNIKKCTDPYSLSLSYSRNAADRKSALIDKSLSCCLPSGGWENLEKVSLGKRKDAVIYEVSVRDFTISEDSGVKNAKGTFTAFIEKIPYLKKLGVTHVQLLPILSFCNNDEMNRQFEASGTSVGNNYNWGYDPFNYFSLSGWYSENPKEPYARIRELKELVKALHKEGLGVILDVVYNHMAKTDFLEDIVPGYYFRRNEDDSFKSASGCGNDIASEKKMMRKLISDSLYYLTAEYHVDGFRFDLMGLIDKDTILQSYEKCSSLNGDIIFLGEGWKMFNGDSSLSGMDQNYMDKTDKVAVFNDEFRDLIKKGGMNEFGLGFITSGETDSEQLFRNCSGQPQVNYKVMNPCNNVNYLDAHDGLTLHDNICCNLNLSDENNSFEIAARMKLGNFLLLTSQGIPFLHAGQESGRSKPALNSTCETAKNFVRNSYKSSDNINQFVWSVSPCYEQLRMYTESLIMFRKNTGLFKIDDIEKINESLAFVPVNEKNLLVYTVRIKEGELWYIIVNADLKEKRVLLKGSDFEIYADSQKASLKAIENPKDVFVYNGFAHVNALTATIIKAKF